MEIPKAGWMLLKQLGITPEQVAAIEAQIDTVKTALPEFARSIKSTVETTDARLAALERKVGELHQMLFVLVNRPHDPHVLDAGPSRLPEEFGELPSPGNDLTQVTNGHA